MKKTSKAVLVGVIAVCAFLPGCGGSSSPSSPSTASIAGTWAGTTNDSLAGAGSIRATISQSGSSVSGTWSSTFPNPNNNNGGTLSGSVNGTSVSLMLTPSIPTSCPFSVTATVNGNQMTGTYAAVNCTVAVTGSINLTKQ